MFEYPRQAEVNRVIPKSKIYSFAKTDRAMRGRFVSQVREIVWKYKLAPETVNLAAAGGVQEIQVFGVGLKTGDLSPAGVRSLVLFIRLKMDRIHRLPVDPVPKLLELLLPEVVV